MFEKINVFKIVQDHLDTFRVNTRDKQKSNLDWIELLLYFAIPAIISLVLVTLFGYLISQPLLGVMLTSMSIFAGLLFNLLLLVFGIINKINGSENIQDNVNLKKIVLRQTLSNVSFCILLSLFIIVMIILLYIFDHQLILISLSFIILSFFGIFILALLIVLKRVYILFKKELE